jgi:ATP-dependent DNA ligase
MNINNFLESLANNNSRNFKIDQLKANSDNEVLREVVRQALDPFTQFYIRKIPEYTPNTGEGISLKFAMDSIGDLTKRLVTGNAGIEHLRANLEALNADDAKVLERIIAKDLKCGVDVSTANKVWKNLIAEYPVMLCSPFEQKLVDKIQFPAYVQTKMDGMRFNAIVRDGKCEFRSRNGKEINLLGNLEEDFITMANGVNCVFDGELLVKDKGIVLDRQTGNGILNKANKGTIKTDEARKVHATIWDLIPYDDFAAGICEVPYSQRLESLCVMADTYQPKKVALVDRWEVDNMEEVNTLFNGLLTEGEEGIILKSRDGIWEDKRSKTQIKFKGELECDLKIVAVEEGSGKAAGMLGAIVCESSDGLVKVSVGSGFSDLQRKTYWDENLVDRIVAIKYNSRITNKQGDNSLFLPVFIELRDDKDVADKSEVIK